MNDSSNSPEKKILAGIFALSIAVLGFLIWLIYFKESAEITGNLVWVKSLPATNAILNTLSTVFLCFGLYFIKANQDIERHKISMFLALCSSAAFLVGYIIYHHFQGDTKFINPGSIKYLYFFILISHIVLSGIVVPMIFSTLYFALAGNLPKHKKIARYTFPVWLYVSITGVLIYLLLKFFNNVP